MMMIYTTEMTQRNSVEFKSPVQIQIRYSLNKYCGEKKASGENHSVHTCSVSAMWPPGMKSSSFWSTKTNCWTSNYHFCKTINICLFVLFSIHLEKEVFTNFNLGAVFISFYLFALLLCLPYLDLRQPILPLLQTTNLTLKPPSDASVW